MPVEPRDALLIGAGLTLAGAATLFYKKKQTSAFKLAYFLTWPTLGSAVLLSCMPDREDMYKRLETHNVLSQEELEERKALAAIQMQMLRGIAERRGEQGPGTK